MAQDQLNLSPKLNERTLSGRKKPDGIATSNVIVSAYMGNNADVFPNVLTLHIPEGSKVADVTFGKGVFWRKVPTEKYDLHPSDIADGVDCRDLPYEDESFDCVVFDPPYMEGLFRMATPLKPVREPTKHFGTTMQMGTKPQKAGA